MESEEDNESPDENKGNEGEGGEYRALEARLEVKRCIVAPRKITREETEIACGIVEIV